MLPIDLVLDVLEAWSCTFETSTWTWPCSAFGFDLTFEVQLELGLIDLEVVLCVETKLVLELGIELGLVFYLKVELTHWFSSWSWSR